MGTPYRQPTYLREESAAKMNPRAKGGKKTSDDRASKKVLNDRLAQAQKDLKTWEGYQESNKKRYAEDLKRVEAGTLPKRYLYKCDYSDTIARLKRRIVELETLLASR